jgi:hypothetical protein
MWRYGEFPHEIESFKVCDNKATAAQTAEVAMIGAGTALDAKR